MRKPHIYFSYYPARGGGGYWKAYTFIRGRAALQGGLGPSYMLYFLGLTPSEALRGLIR